MEIEQWARVHQKVFDAIILKNLTGGMDRKRSDTWIVGFIKNDPGPEQNTWSIVGVYDDEEKAIKVCITEDHFGGPLVMNETNDEASGGVSP